jgi:hypothetical protein
MPNQTRNWKQLGYSFSVLLLAVSCSQADFSRSEAPQTDASTIAASQSPAEVTSSQLTEDQLINALQQGGYVIYLSTGQKLAKCE